MKCLFTFLISTISLTTFANDFGLGVSTPVALNLTDAGSEASDVCVERSVDCSPLLATSDLDDGLSSRVLVNEVEWKASNHPSSYIWSATEPGVYVLTHEVRRGDELVGERLVVTNIVCAINATLILDAADRPLSEQYPATYTFYKRIKVAEGVTEICNGCFSGCLGLQDIELPSTVTKVSDGAFAGCISLSSVTIPPNVTVIGESAFDGCSSLKSVTILSAVTDVEDCVFYGCSSLASIAIPSSVTSVGWGAFCGCSSLTSVTMPSGVTYIGDYAFCECDLLTAVAIPAGVTYIGENAFEGCASLKSVTIPSSVTYIGENAFEGCSSVERVTITCDNASEDEYAFSIMSLYDSLPDGLIVVGTAVYKYKGVCPAQVTIPSGVKSIGDGAFSDCSSLMSVMIPSGVTCIGSSAFSDCSSLMSLTMPSSLTYIGGYAFADCYSLKSVKMPSGVVYMGDGVFSGCYSLGSVTMPSSLTSIGDCAFSDCYALSSITIPSRVRCIGEWAFDGCSSLKSVTIPSSVTNVGYSAFGNCASLTSVTIPSSVVFIDENTFYGCSSLRSVKIPSGVMGIGAGAFGDCSSLTSVTIPASVMSVASDAFYGTPYYCNLFNRLPDGVVVLGSCAVGYKGTCPAMVEIPSGVTGIGSALCGCSTLMTVKIPSSVKYILGGAFSGCSSLRSVTIPSSVTYIGWRSFADCSSLRSVTILSGAAIIEDQAFQGCSSLTSVTIPSSVSSIGDEAFSGCSFLRSVTIPSSVTDIGMRAFEDCSSLTSVTIPSSVTSIGYRAFEGTPFYDDLPEGLIVLGSVAYGYKGWCPETVDIPNGVTRIEEDAFKGRSSLTSVTIPSSVTSIGDGAFAGCSSLESVEIPVKVTTIEYNVFSGCSSLKSVTIPPSVASIGGYAFYGCSSLSSVTIPSGVTSIGYRAFEGTPFYDDLPDGLVVLGSVVYGYKGECPAAIRIPNGVTGIADEAFRGCSSLTSVSIPSSVMSIGYSAFEGSSSLPLLIVVQPGDTARMHRVLDSVSFRKFVITEDSLFDAVEVIFDAQGGECVESFRKVVPGNQVGVLPTPTRAKYKFDGWYSASSGGTKVTASTKVAADTTYYAHWTYDGSATVVVEIGRACSDMGTVSGGKTAKVGTKVTLKATAKSGYVFAGWYKDAEFEDPIEGDVDYRSPSYSYVIGEDDVTFYARFVPLDEDDVDIWFDVEDEYARGDAISPIVVDVCAGSLPTVKTTGTLPAGVKFTAKALTVKATKTTPEMRYEANTFYGTPTKSGVYVVTVTATTAGKKSVSKNVKFVVRAPGENVIDADWDAVGGKVTGMGVVAKGKSLTLKATANKGYVFAGWYCEEDFTTPAEGSVDYRTASFAVADNAADQKLYARFVPSSEDRSIVSLVDDSYDLNGPWSYKLDIDSRSLPTVTTSVLPTGLKYNAKTLTIAGTPTKPGTYTVKLSIKNVTVKTAVTQTITINVANIESPYLKDVDYAKDAYYYYGGVSTVWDIGSCAQGGYTVSNVTGLPTGLKFDPKTGMITGVPTKAGTFTATISLKNGKLSSLATVTMTVEGLPAWAYGTFDGGADDCQVQLTVSNVGKISGKMYRDGIVYTLSAPSYSSFDGCCEYYADLTASWSVKEDGKTVKKTESWPVTVCDNSVGGEILGDYFNAVQNVWSQKVWKEFGISLFGKSGMVETLAGSEYGLDEDESIQMTIKSDGKVTLKGKFNTGKTDSRGNPVYYSATGSAVVCVFDARIYERTIYSVIFVYFAPNAAKGFAGYTRAVYFDFTDD